MLLSIAGCSKSTEVDDPVPIPSDTTSVIDTTAVPIELDRQWMWLDAMRESDTIKVLGGNGEYRIYQPKQIAVRDSGVGQLVDNDKRTFITNVIGDSMIVITRTRAAGADMLLMDSRGKKRILFVLSVEVDLPLMYDYELSEKLMLGHYPDLDLWYIE